jgi:hypothetical protein
MSLLDRFRQKKDDPEQVRLTRLLRTGRIAEGKIFDVGSDDSGDITQIFYRYNISGVEYESSQTLNTDQRQRLSDYAPGAQITIRYDPQHPFNSVVV